MHQGKFPNRHALSINIGHSARREATGLAIAALIDFQPMVTSARIQPTMNTQSSARMPISDTQ
jgi:hypothetical protein